MHWVLSWIRRVYGPWLLLPFAAAGALLLVAWAAIGAGSIGWEAELVAALSGPTFGLDGSSTVFRGEYAWGDVGGGMGGASQTFGENGSRVDGTLCLPLPNATTGTVAVGVYHRTDLVIDWPVGTWGIAADASLSLDTSRMTSLSATANVTAYGTSTTATFHLNEDHGVYRSGLTLELAGTALSGMGVSIAASFGALLGSAPAEPCGFEFRGFAVGVEGLPWCCVHTDVDLTFGQGGFEQVEIDVDIDLAEGLLTFDGSLWFEIDEKRVNLIPRIHLNQQCIWFNVGIEPQGIGSGAPNVIESLVVRGFGVTACDIGTAEFSASATLGTGLYRAKRSSDLELHAGGYYIALDPTANPGQYVQTNFAMVWTVAQGFMNAEWTIDAYFSAGGATLFDLALLTAEWAQQLGSGLDVRLALQVDPTGAAHKLLFGVTTEAPLP